MAHKVQGSGALHQKDKERSGQARPKNDNRHQGKRITQLRHTTSHK